MNTHELLRLLALSTTHKQKPETIITIKKDEAPYLRVMLAWFLDHLEEEEEYAVYKNVCRKVIAQIDTGK